MRVTAGKLVASRLASEAQDTVAGFIANLEAAAPAEGTAAAELLAGLKATGDAQAHRERVAGFFAACNARDPAALVADVLRVISSRRALAQARDLFEFDATLPVDDLPVDPELRLDPATCELASD